LGLPILVSNEVSYPLTWYLRAFTSVGFITPSLDAGQPGDAVPLKDSRGNYYGVIIIKGTEDQPKLQAELKGQYTRYETRFRWFFPQYDNGYGSISKAPPDTPADKVQLEKNKIQNTDWGKLWDTFTKQPSAGQMWRYIMYREMANPPDSEALVYYVRNELEPDLPVASGQQTPTGSNTADTNTSGVYDLTTSTKAGNGKGQYRIPRTLAFAPDGSIYVLDSGNARVQKFSAEGKFLFSFGKFGTGLGEFNLISLNPANLNANDGGPAGIAVDGEGNVFVSDTWNYRIEKFDANGTFLSTWGQGLDVRNNPDLAKANLTGFYGPRGLAYDLTKGELYVTDTGNRRIIVFDNNGNPLRQFGSSGSQPGQFNEPTGIAVSPEGKVYVTDLRNKRLQILDTNGNYLSEISIPDWKEQALSEPYVTLDSKGNIYVSDSGNARILKFSKDGVPLGTLGGQVGQSLENPIGVAVGADGYLYVADGKRHSIVKLLL
jgi:DNA-binding beta-propeller fold protein YncE